MKDWKNITGGSSFVGEYSDLGLKFRHPELRALGELLEKGGNVCTTGWACLIQSRLLQSIAI